MGGKKNRPKTKWRKLSLDDFKSSETEDVISESGSPQHGRKPNRYHSKEVNSDGSEPAEQGYHQDFQDGVEHFDTYEDYQGAEGEAEADEITGCYVNGLWVPQSEIHRLAQSGGHPPLLVPSPTGYTMLVPRPLVPSANFVFPTACIPSSAQQFPPYFRLRSDFRFQKPFRLPRRSFRLAPYWGSLNAPYFANMPQHLPPAPPPTPPPPDNTPSVGDAVQMQPTEEELLSPPISVQQDDLPIDRLEDQILAPSYVYPGYTYGPAVYCPHFVPAPNGAPFLPPPGPLLPPLDFANSRGRRRRRKYRGRFHYGMEGPSREVWRASDEKKKLNTTTTKGSDASGSTKPEEAAATTATVSSTSATGEKCDDAASTAVGSSNQTSSKVSVRPTDLDLPSSNVQSDSLLPSELPSTNVVSDTIVHLVENVVDKAIREATSGKILVTSQNASQIETSQNSIASPTAAELQDSASGTITRTFNTVVGSEIAKMADDLAKQLVSEAQTRVNRPGDVRVVEQSQDSIGSADTQGNTSTVAKETDATAEQTSGSGKSEQKNGGSGDTSAESKVDSASAQPTTQKAPRFIVVTIPSDELSDSEFMESSSDEEQLRLPGTCTPDPLTVFDAERLAYPAATSKEANIKVPQNTPNPGYLDDHRAGRKSLTDLISFEDIPVNNTSPEPNCGPTDNQANGDEVKESHITSASTVNPLMADNTFSENNTQKLGQDSVSVDNVNGEGVQSPEDNALPQNFSASSTRFVEVPLSDTTSTLLNQRCFRESMGTDKEETLFNSSRASSSDDEFTGNHIMSSRTRVENWLMNQETPSQPSTVGSVASSMGLSSKNASYNTPGGLSASQRPPANKELSNKQMAATLPQRSDSSTPDNISSGKLKSLGDQPRASPAYLSFLGQSDTLLRETEMELNRLKMLQSCKTNQTIYKLAYDETVSEGQSSDNNEIDGVISHPLATTPNNFSAKITNNKPASAAVLDVGASSFTNIQVPREPAVYTESGSVSRSHSEIMVHEKDSASEAGSEDVELLPHRYESESAVQKHLYVNKLSLATELLRTKETLPYDKEFKRVVEDSTEESDSCRSRSNATNYFSSHANKGGKPSNAATSGKGTENLGFVGDGTVVISGGGPRKSHMSAADSGVQSEESSDEVAEEAREKMFDPLSRTTTSEEEEEREIWRTTGTPGRYRRFGLLQQAGQRARGLPIRDSTWPCLCCVVM